MNTQWTLDPATAHAGRVDTLFLFLVAVSALVILGITTAVTFFILKYRRGKDADRTNPVETHHKLELTWTILPLIAFLGVFLWAGRLYFQMYDVPSDAMEIYVIGKQWMWKFQHPDSGQIEVNDLHVPVNRPIKLTMTSEDVIHSMYVPAFRIKTDVLPGRYTTVWFEATETGSYHLFCAEYCGTDHAGMTGQVIVMPEEEYLAWASGGGTTGGQPLRAQAGEQLFNRTGCIARTSSTVRLPWPGARRHLRAGSQADQRGNRDARRGVPAQVDSGTGNPGGRGLSAGHAALSGAVDRGSGVAAHRLYQRIERRTRGAQ